MDEAEIVDYVPRWPLLFDEEARRLRAVLDPSLIVGPEHFGSTAINLDFITALYNPSGFDYFVTGS